MVSKVVYQLVTEGVSSENFGGEIVAVNFTNGKYYGLGGTAPLIWDLLSLPRSMDDLIDELCRFTGTGRGQVELHIAGFLRQLQDEGLITAKTDNGASGPVPIESSVTAEQEFAVPELTVYNDLQELIMLDPVHDADPEHGWPNRREDHITKK